MSVGPSASGMSSSAPPQQQRSPVEEALTSRLLLLSARDPEALQGRIDDLLAHVASGKDPLADVAYTLAFGRQAMAHRAAVVLPHGRDLEAACAPDAALISRAKVKPGEPSVVFMFPGQGSQYVGMGRQLYERHQRFRALVDHCDGVLEPKLGLSLRQLVFAPEPQADPERAEALKQTAIAQPALFVIEYALADLLQHYGVRPAALMGHSIGEYAAACVAGVFELDAALALVAERGRLMQSMPPGSMLAVMADVAEVEPLCQGGIDLAAHNAPGLVVVSGPTAEIEAFERSANERGLDTRALHTSHAFHSAMMEPILEPFAQAVEAAGPAAPRLPIISTMTGALLTEEEARSGTYWARQLRTAVRFADAVSCACAQPERVLLEVGPGMALASSAAKQRDVASRPRKILETLGHPKAEMPAVDATLRCLGQLWGQGVEADWSAVFGGDERRLVRLPRYRYSRKRHWIEPPAATGVPTAGLAPAPSGQAAAAEAQPTGSPETHVLRALGELLGSRLGVELAEDDLQSTFLEIGFDSLALSQLVAKLRPLFGVQVKVRRLFEDLNTPALLAAHLVAEGASGAAPSRPRSAPAGSAPAAASAAVGADSGALAAILERLERIEQRLAGTLEPAELATESVDDAREGSPLTASQREIWLSVELGGDEANLAYNECRAFHFEGALDVDALGECLARLPQRHEALRHTFTRDGERCVTHASMDLPLAQTDARGQSEAERAACLEAVRREQVATPFDLATGPLLRGHLVRLTDDEAELVLCAHHIAVDGSSWEILIRELSTLYSARVEGRDAGLPEADAFATYRDLELGHTASAAGREDEAFWLKHLADQSESLDLPADRPRPAQRSFASTRLDQQLSPALVERVRTAAQRNSCTPQTLLLGAFQILLYRLTRQTDLVVGIPTSGQAAAGMERLLGHCVHVLPLRTLLDPEQPLQGYLRALHGSMLDGLEHQRFTFTELLHKLQRPRDASRPALVQVAFGMGRSQKRPSFAGLETRLHVVPRVSETFELYVYATEAEGGLEVSWSYSTGLFSADTIGVWQRGLEQVIEELLTAPEGCTVADVDAVAPVDRERLLSLAWGREVDYADHVPVHRRIAQTAAARPTQVAVRDAWGAYSYADLEARANQIAHFLVAEKLAPGELVGVCLGRSFDLVAVLIGVWRAGHGYVPLDPGFPAQRIEVIVEDSGSTLALTTRDLLDRLPEGVRAICLEDVEQAVAALPTTPPELTTGPEDTAYVIFTSGSTGRPKGVQIPQRAAENFIQAMQYEPGFTADDRLLAITTISFDISVLELFVPLVAGGSVTVATRDQGVDPGALQRLLSEHDITVMQATPATWQMLFEGGWTGNPRLKVLCGGEAFPKRLAERFLEACGEVWNVYGPTETTVWSAVAQVTDADDLAIGRPIDNTSVYVLDERMRLVPPGAHGELWIGGRGVALGYLGRPELTAERFMQSPFDASDLIYRTGDLARMRSGGALECLGRIDNQVKVRGFRIELGEIEANLATHPSVTQCVVVARDDVGGERALVAYCVPEAGETLDPAELQKHLQATLPRYMWPSVFVSLDELPQTPNGKVDRKRLPAPPQGAVEAGPPGSQRDSGARDDLDLGILAVWQEHLRRTDITIDDDFFALGGDSMTAIRVLADIHKAVGLELPLATLFEYATIRGIREHLGEDAERAASIMKLNRADSGRPIYCIAGVLVYKPLAECFEDAPVYGVFANREVASIETWGSKQKISVPVDELADTYADALERHVVGKQLALVGVSFGGVLALEVSKRLEARGYDVTDVVLLDTILRGTRQRSVGKVVTDVAKAAADGRGLALAKQLGSRASEMLSERRRGPLKAVAQRVVPDAAQGQAFLRMSRAYDTTGKRFARDILLVKALKKQLGIGQRLLDDYGFGELIDGEVSLAEIDTEHMEMLQGHAAGDLHRIIDGYMRARAARRAE